MGLNINSERAVGLLRELATHTGANQTAAIKDVVARRLVELDRDESAGIDERCTDPLPRHQDYRAQLCGTRRRHAPRRPPGDRPTGRSVARHLPNRDRGLRRRSGRAGISRLRPGQRTSRAAQRRRHLRPHP
ncbi:type II toxin-antitoxin system VapB family antitoxin [Mycobacterium vicinigordonae]|uniref:Type II toxin-antitoxin system VapB family antitoxin n=1 Tax=Mycobacterium vicinigordonae TaxID=1719132 RepID=A0A7D6IM13_9MYCO|nr:type II toxin-antitoxin system VapB family antitoxin [Mycobacterium vicinigordonae]